MCVSAESCVAGSLCLLRKSGVPMRIHLFCSDVTAVRKREISSHLFSPFSCSVVFGLVWFGLVGGGAFFVCCCAFSVALRLSRLRPAAAFAFAAQFASSLQCLCSFASVLLALASTCSGLPLL